MTQTAASNKGMHCLLSKITCAAAIIICNFQSVSTHNDLNNGTVCSIRLIWSLSSHAPNWFLSRTGNRTPFIRTFHARIQKIPSGWGSFFSHRRTKMYQFHRGSYGPPSRSNWTYAFIGLPFSQCKIVCMHRMPSPIPILFEASLIPSIEVPEAKEWCFTRQLTCSR